VPTLVSENSNHSLKSSLILARREFVSSTLFPHFACQFPRWQIANSSERLIWALSARNRGKGVDGDEVSVHDLGVPKLDGGANY
jgi:hypothetical protein